MKTKQAWGWLTAGVLALGLNGVYHDGGAAWTHRTVGGVIDRIAERTEPILALASGRADLFMAKTGMVAARSETASCRWATAVARVQSKVARTRSEFAQFEVISAREEAALARLEANRARIEAQVARVRVMPVAFESVTSPVVCPRIRVNVPRVSIPRLPVVRVPEVHVEMPSAGPV
jgi:hypothetical protein